MKLPHFKFLLMACLTLGTVFAASLPKYDSGLLVYFLTTKGKGVYVKGPSIYYEDGGDPYYDWNLISSTASPDGEFFEAHYLGTRPKYWEAVVYLINPNGKVAELKSSQVRKTQWTDDSRYLLGFGDNAIRVWNMSGGHRQINLENFSNYKYKNHLLCVEVGSYEIDQKAQIDGRHVEIYSIPTLKRLSSLPYLDVAGCHQ